MKKPKILFYDIETSPNIAYTWGKYKQDIPAFLKERELLSFAYKWLGEKKVTVISRRTISLEKQLLKVLADLIQEADITVAHNGDEFDRKIIKTRMLYYGMDPVKVNCSVDTYKVARSYFNFNSNKLNDLCQYLDLGAKITHSGISLWDGCLKGDKKSWLLMEQYNKQDVVLVEKLYLLMQPWIENHPNIAKLMGKKQTYICPSCLSISVKKKGTRATVARIQQRLQCTDCRKNWCISYKEAS